MERHKKMLVLGIIELLTVTVLVLWYNISMILPFPWFVAFALSWFLTGSGVTLLGLTYTFRS